MKLVPVKVYMHLYESGFYTGPDFRHNLWLVQSLEFNLSIAGRYITGSLI